MLSDAETRMSHHTPNSPVRVSLISTFSEKHSGTIAESLGCEALAGHLIWEHGSEVDVTHTDLQLDSDINALIQSIAERPPHILGLSVKVWSLEQVDQLMKELSSIDFPNGRKPMTVMGWVLPTLATAKLLTRYPEIIMAVCEGENATSDLVDVVKGSRWLQQVRGIHYVDENGTPHQTHYERTHLAHRHLPARITTQRIQNELHGQISAEASRGCGFNCSFCSVHQLHRWWFNGDIKPESVVDDLKNLKRLGIQSVGFTDDDFCGDPDRTARLARLLRDEEINLPFYIATRADHIWDEGLNHRHKAWTEGFEAYNNQLLETMTCLRDAGLTKVFIGMESGSPTQLKRYGKQISVEGNYRAIEILRQLSIDVVAGYIPLDPLMTLQELRENIIFLRRTGMYTRITNPLSVLRVQAGSPYLELAKKRWIIDAEPDTDWVFYKARFESATVQKIASLADKWVQDLYPLIFWLKGSSGSHSSHGWNSQTQIAEKLLFSFRELEMDFIEALTWALYENPVADTTAMVNQFIQKRWALVKQCETLSNGWAFGDNVVLREIIKNFNS